jgi:two-component system, chemotaxis family, chemotaxis protein CheY
MRILIVEDEFISRHLLQELLLPYGICDTAINGKEALEVFINALDSGNPYDLICLDIMMPEMDGQEVLKNIRAIEREKGILGLDGTKIIMTTALEDFGNIKSAFVEQCEGYLVKPITKHKIIKQLKELDLIKEER